ncbi:MAG: hypothetical protein SFY80_17490 [Verrucomicrobiota bacterium]|nr:hypothetical protein [Verrucomicrobiota bacterium]
MWPKVYICSNIAHQPLNILRDTLCAQGFTCDELFYYTEAQYRAATSARGIKHLWFRLNTYGLYPFWLFFKLWSVESGAVVVITSNTFYAPLISAMVGRIKRYNSVHLLYDLFPDALEVAGKLKPGSLPVKLLGIVQRLTCKYSQATVFLGQGLKQHYAKRWGTPKCCAVVDVSDAIETYAHVILAPYESTGLRIRYGGQCGYMHDAYTLARCIHDAKQQHPSVTYDFFASGVGIHVLKRELSHGEINYSPVLQNNNWRDGLGSYSVSLVTLSAGGATVCLPSKLYGMLAAGHAIIAICPIWSDVARIILENKVGWVVDNSYYDKLEEIADNEYVSEVKRQRSTEEISRDFSAVIASILSDQTELHDYQKNARQVATEKFGKAEVGRQWSAFFGELLK